MSFKKRTRTSAGVELNLTAMLDMAFQLLAFFILTFRTAPNEGQVVINLPPAAQVGKSIDAPGGGDPTVLPPSTDDTLVVSLFGGPSGKVEQLAIGDRNIASLDRLKTELRADVANPHANFQQLIVQVSSDVRYDNVMQVVDLCAKLKRADGSPITSLSLVERPSGSHW